jgi:gliding motility-associated-like protein
MNKNTISLFALCAGAFMLVNSARVNAQIFYSNGAQVWATTGSIVQINGGLQDDNAGTIDNEGIMTVTSNGATPGNIWISNNAILQGNGRYNLDQNWINDANFIHDNSAVNMNGNLAQYITSNNGTVTTFDSLILSGNAPYGSLNARKIQTLDAKDSGTLILNNRVLWTQNHTMFVINPAVGCVQNWSSQDSGGFVQSETTGSLSRMTNANARYFFPVGSDTDTWRYRPAFMKPAAAVPNTYTAKLVNWNASKDGDSTKLFDTNICTVNQLFYHQLNRTAGASNADIDIYYDNGATADGAWGGIAQWNTPTATVWNDMGAVTVTSVASHNLSDNLKLNWSTFSPTEPYALDNVKPSAPVLNCGSVCAGADGTFTVTGAGSSYTWTTPAGTTILNGQGTDSLTVKWNGTGGTITVIANSAAGCVSKPASCIVTVNPSPNAGFDTVSSGKYHNDWGFTDTSKNGANWVWNFGDGNTSNLQNPPHIYNEPGTYIVTETVTGADGCSSERIDTVIVTEGFYVPNIITPNGDGINDVLTIQCSGVSDFNLQIFNRWGQEMFVTNDVNIAWDGRTNAGVKVSDGTYYYTIKAHSVDGKDWSTKGFITVLGSGVGGQ